MIITDEAVDAAWLYISTYARAHPEPDLRTITREELAGCLTAALPYIRPAPSQSDEERAVSFTREWAETVSSMNPMKEALLLDYAAIRAEEKEKAEAAREELAGCLTAALPYIRPAPSQSDEERALLALFGDITNRRPTEIGEFDSYAISVPALARALAARGSEEREKAAQQFKEYIERSAEDEFFRIEEARKQEREACAQIALSHKGAAKRKRKEKGFRLTPDSRDEIWAEERGEDMASEMIAAAIRARGEHGPSCTCYQCHGA